MGPLQRERALLGVPECGFRAILTNFAGMEKKLKTETTHDVLNFQKDALNQ